MKKVNKIHEFLRQKEAEWNRIRNDLVRVITVLENRNKEDN